MSQPHDFSFDITDVAELLHLRIRRPSPQGLYGTVCHTPKDLLLRPRLLFHA